MGNAAKEQATAEVKLEMTSMIDVTFLLLIFFMCTIKFKILEGKLQTYLPKDVGVNATPAQEMLQKVDIRIIRTATRDKLDLDDKDTFKKWRDRGWSESEIEIYFQTERIASLKELGRQLKELRKTVPAPVNPGPEDEDDLKMNLEAMAGCIYEDIVHVVDIALDAKFTSITFRGIDLDA
ncbi:MAG: biopolymer transporter ExbD [Planctomycetes bacterium]|nr:biopolymer transporter ExbD [Planctomycetota bacterium]